MPSANFVAGYPCRCKIVRHTEGKGASGFHIEVAIDSVESMRLNVRTRSGPIANLTTNCLTTRRDDHAFKLYVTAAVRREYLLNLPLRVFLDAAIDGAALRKTKDDNHR